MKTGAPIAAGVMPRAKHIKGLYAARLADAKRERVSSLPPQSGKKRSRPGGGI